MTDIYPILFRLLVEGNYVKVPGQEPISAETSVRLANAMVGKYATIPVATALALIPGSTVVRDSLCDGTSGAHRWFILPSGAAPSMNDCPQTCLEDWYKILRDNAVAPTETSSDAFDFETCQGYASTQCDLTNFANSLDPGRR